MSFPSREEQDAEILLDWIRTSPKAERLRRNLKSHPDPETAITAWAYEHSGNAPPQIANYVSGGQVDRLVNVAHVDTFVSQLPEVSRSNVIFYARGLSRVLIVAGTFLGIAAFAALAYPIVRSIAKWSAANQARDDCTRLHPDRGLAWLNCMDKAAKISEFQTTPWIPLAFGLFVISAILATIGIVMVRLPDSSVRS
jgi:hypothetical protein